MAYGHLPQGMSSLWKVLHGDQSSRQTYLQMLPMFHQIRPARQQVLLEQQRHRMTTIVKCEWMQVVKAIPTACGELPTTKARNGSYYCSFHYAIGKDFPPFESEPGKPGAEQKAESKSDRARQHHPQDHQGDLPAYPVHDLPVS
jgi:hypothetical protein